MIRAIIFDLDDTLYEEIQFVRGGFNAVSLHVAKNNGISKEKVYGFLMSILERDGRGLVFDTVLRGLNIYNRTLVSKMVEIYRMHKPVLLPYPEAPVILDSLKKAKYKIGMITDGNAQVQRRKVEALGIGIFFDSIIFPDEYGIDKRKPNSFCYKKALEELETRPEESIYIGDNPCKDFITAKKIGMHTARIMKGQHKDMVLEAEYEAEHRIKSLAEVFTVLQIYNRSHEDVCYNKK